MRPLTRGETAVNLDIRLYIADVLRHSQVGLVLPIFNPQPAVSQPEIKASRETLETIPFYPAFDGDFVEVCERVRRQFDEAVRAVQLEHMVRNGLGTWSRILGQARGRELQGQCQCDRK